MSSLLSHESDDPVGGPKATRPLTGINFPGTLPFTAICPIKTQGSHTENPAETEHIPQNFKSFYSVVAGSPARLS